MKNVDVRVAWMFTAIPPQNLHVLEVHGDLQGKMDDQGSLGMMADLGNEAQEETKVPLDPRVTLAKLDPLALVDPRATLAKLDPLALVGPKVTLDLPVLQGLMGPVDPKATSHV